LNFASRARQGWAFRRRALPVGFFLQAGSYFRDDRLTDPSTLSYRRRSASAPLLYLLLSPPPSPTTHSSRFFLLPRLWGPTALKFLPFVQSFFRENFVKSTFDWSPALDQSVFSSPSGDPLASFPYLRSPRASLFSLSFSPARSSGTSYEVAGLTAGLRGGFAVQSGP